MHFDLLNVFTCQGYADTCSIGPIAIYCIMFNLPGKELFRTLQGDRHKSCICSHSYISVTIQLQLVPATTLGRDYGNKQIKQLRLISSQD